MDIQRRLLTAAALLLSLLIIGTIGFKLVEGWNWLDSVYMTIITLSTVGYAEVHRLDSSGRVFTSALIVVGVGAMFYALGTVVTVAVEGELASVLGGRRMRSKIGNLQRHYIVCGYGRVGQEVAREFRARLTPFVMVDKNEEALQRARRHGYLVYEGDASQDETLIDAGVRRARGLVAASDSDAVNTYIVLTAKALNPSLFVVARVGIPENTQKLVHAGADRVISPYQLAGHHMAVSAAEARGGIDTIETTDHQQQIILAEIMIAGGSILAGVSLRSMFRDCATVTVLAIRHPNGQVTVNPEVDTRVSQHDVIVVLGGTSDLESVNELAQTQPLRDSLPLI
ncbi:MAG: potassium channel family protein [Dehalococcoidia bacterium]